MLFSHSSSTGVAARMMVIVSAAALLAGCVPIQHAASRGNHTDTYGVPIGNQQVSPGGELVMGLSAEPDKLDPTTSSSLYTRYVMTTMCEKLYDLDASGQIVPQLATGLPTIADGGLSVTIPVRTGIVFADGTPFDANAVRTSLQRHLTMKGSQRPREVGPIASSAAPDGSHVLIRYKRPFAPITAALADRAGMM